MAVSKQPSITPETSSAEGLEEEQSSRGEAKWKRFHPFRVVRKIFRRRVKRQGTGEETETSKKSWSTSELQSVQNIPSKYEAPSPPYKIGLSVSHDSIFSPESSNLISSEELNRPQGSSLSMQHAGIKNMFKDELFSKVRARRDSDDDDIGLPHSPCTSPTTVDVLTQGLKPKSMKTCSAGSLVSMGSSENDEDSAMASSSGNSSRMSLLDRRSLDFEGDPDLSQPVPLNHQAAHHRIAVRPKRTHGLPQKRLKQVAASKLNTLPATPEVTEYLKAESTTTTITSTASMHQISRLVASRENAVSYSTSEKMMTESKSSTELSQFDKKESHVKMLSHSLISSLQADNQYINGDATIDRNEPLEHNLQMNPESSSFRGGRENAIVDHYPVERLQTAEYSKRLDNAQVQRASEKDHKQKLVDKESFLQPTSKNEDKGEPRHEGKNPPQEPPLRVASLIKNIEQSDTSINLNEKLPPVEESHTSVKINDNFASDTSSFNTMDIVEKTTVTSDVKTESCCQMNSEEGTTSVNKPIDLGFRMANVCFNEYKGNGTLNNNNINSPRSLYDNDVPLQEQSQMEKEIRQQFQQQKIITKHKKNAGTMSGLCPEEESIMSDKCVSPSSAERSPSIENGKISISHHISHDSAVHQEKLTETHNLVTVDETFNLNVQGFSSSIVSMESGTHQREPWISSFGVSSPTTQSTDVTVNSITSNIYSQKLTEDRVTISINSSELKSTVSETQSDEAISNSTAEHPLTNSKDCITPVTGNLISSIKKDAEEKVGKPEIKKKSPSPEGRSKTPFTKNINVSKKLSVEIVPFSQRMKEKAYQPLSFVNKSAASEAPKVAPVIAVERNMSERRISPKGKDGDKCNNRHSFSGTLPTELDPHVMNSCIDKKPAGKIDQLRYPVQIRIHKNKVDEKENSGEKLNANKVGNEIQPETAKSPRESKHASDVPPKWEVKVQSASQTKETVLSQSEIKRALSDSKSIINMTCTSEESKDISLSSWSSDARSNHTPTTSPVTEDGLLKNKDGTRKPVRETSASKDPEPELLRVFARRSIKQKHSDKDKHDEREDNSDDISASESPSSLSSLENCKVIEPTATSPIPNSAAKLADAPEPLKSISPEVVRKKSKCFSEKEKPPQLSTPLKDTNIHRRPSLKAMSPDIPAIESENFHRRQRTASEPEVLVTLPPITDNIACLKNYQNNALETNMLLTCRSDHLQRTASMSISPSSTLSNGTSATIRSDLEKGKENPDGPAPSWLQLAQQRRELREQRERLLLGSSTNSFLDASSKPSRSSKVWDMVNNFQKLQMT